MSCNHVYKRRWAIGEKQQHTIAVIYTDEQCEHSMKASEQKWLQMYESINNNTQYGRRGG